MVRGLGAITVATAACAALLLLLVWGLGAGSARAAMVRLPDGHLVAVTPRAGVAPAGNSGAHPPAVDANVDNGEVDYHGGPVVHSSAPYLIFWDPQRAIPSSTETLLTRYFGDVAHDSGLASNDYGVLRQYSDHTGIADYAQTFSPAAQVIDDTDPYPTPDNGTSSCPDAGVTYPICLTDAQLQAELTNLISTDGLPTDGSTSADGLAANAPIYFMVTPVDVDICLAGDPNPDCADTGFCSYHDFYSDQGSYVLYATVPLINADNTNPSPKECQVDNNAALQEPNAPLDPAGGDVAIKFMTHEDSEAITDPLLDAWYDPSSGNEIADNCNVYQPSKPLGPANGNDVNAFVPTLGGSATPVPPAKTGTLYNQLDNGDEYYVQSMWSNGDVNCELRPSGTPPSASFTAPSGPQLAGTPVTFDPLASSSIGGYSSIGWSFGDGTTSFASTATLGSQPTPAAVTHAYTTPGTYTVTLTLVDPYGDLAQTSRTVTVIAPPVAAFSFSPVTPIPRGTVTFDASGSSDPNAGGSVTSYSWSFGDGTTGTGAAPSHTYTTPGLYTVQLTVSDSLGLSSATTSETVEVLAPLSAGFTYSPRAPAAGGAVAFKSGGSSDPNVGGSLTAYKWSFGDGATATAVSPSHTYRKKGAYMVELTVTDSFGISASTGHVVTVAAAPGRPQESHESLSGVARGEPRLSFQLTAGRNAPSLAQIEIGLPKGLRFDGQRLAKGMRVVGAGAKRLSFRAALSRGTLRIKLGRPASMSQVTISGAAITAARSLARGVGTGKVKTLVVVTTAIDRAGRQTRLAPKLKV